MRIKTILLGVMVFAAGCGDAQTKPETKETTEKKTELAYTKGDLKKIKWIEGKWKGLYNGSPFYEMYQFTNDSTLEITSYEWNGKDSSKTSKSYVYFKGNAYYLGDKMNWKVSSITDTEIKMLPNVEAYNDIVWRYKDSQHWDALLTSKKGTTTYNMEHFDPFKK